MASVSIAPLLVIRVASLVFNEEKARADSLQSVRRATSKEIVQCC